MALDGQALAMVYYRSLYTTDITSKNLMERVVNLMMFVEREPSIVTGDMKQSVVIAVIEKVIEESLAPDNIIEKALVSAILPSIMEMIIKADKNHISINPKTVLTFGGILKFFSCISSQVHD